MKLASIVIRTYNEQRYLDQLLASVAKQRCKVPHEVLIVDSGSTDRTLSIARSHNCHIVKIDRSEFSFGRSLNLGCENANGDVFVFVSGHCIPIDDLWLESLLSPLLNGEAVYSYGRQLAGDSTKYSEKRLFEKNFPARNRTDNNGFFCNNANAALDKEIWCLFQFREDLTGLEDLELAKRITAAGHSIVYAPEAGVYHHHHESWIQVRRRYEREAIALQHIMPEVHISLLDFVRYVYRAVTLDLIGAYHEGRLSREALEILIFRVIQFWGAYKGNHQHRKLSRAKKELYFYPK